jgi:hypothetical protein
MELGGHKKVPQSSIWYGPKTVDARFGYMAEEEPIHIDTQDARAGATPHMTRYVLGFGLVLVIVAFAVILAW